MGHMSLCYFQDEDRNRIDNLFKENDRLSHMAQGGFMVLEPYANRIFLEGEDRMEKRQRRFLDDPDVTGRVVCSHPQHTSQKGVLIVTTDYVIDLCLASIPDECSLFGSVINHLAVDYRKTLIRRRHHLGRDHAFVTKKKVLSDKPELASTLEEGQKHVEVGKKLGHLVGINYDTIHEHLDESGKGASQAVGAAYRDLLDRKEPSEDLEPFVCMRNGPLHPYEQCLNHWVSLHEDDVVILAYEHLLPTKAFFGSRKKRTPANILRTELAMLPGDTVSEAIYLKEYTLMREFFASQGLRIEL